MSRLAVAIQFAGAIQLVVAALNLALPRVLGYRENLPRLEPIVRQVFVIHSIYIVLVLLIFGGLCVGFAGELASGSTLGRYLSASFAVFWLLRLGFQLFYYDREFRRRRLWLDRLLVPVVSYLAAVFLVAAMAGSPAVP